MKMKKMITLSLIVLLGLPCTGANVTKRSILIQKNFELCFQMAQDGNSAAVLASDPVLTEFARQKREAFGKASTEEDALKTVMFSKEEIGLIGDRLAEISSTPALKQLCSNLKKRGRYFIFNELPDGEFLRSAWAQDAGGINKIIDVYALDGKPHSSIDIPDPRFKNLPYYIDALAKVVRPGIRENALALSSKGLFYALTLEVALAYLDANDRYEATDFEPMATGINAKAYAKVRSTKWEKYPYSAILVLGAGPNDEGQALNPKGRVRCAYAAGLYLQGQAPFLILSGGRAHPAMTPYSEAEEMKRYLMEVFGIPEEAIIAEPHARHTTTNVRNAARIMLTTGFPMDKPALMSSTQEQLNSVEKPRFQDRCRMEMLVVPFRLGERLNTRELVFWPLSNATQINPVDPLDP